MEDDLNNLSTEELMAIAGIAPAPSAPTGPGGPKLVVPGKPDKPEGPPAGYRFTPTGQLEPIPGGPADPKTKKPEPTELELRDEITRIQSLRDQIRDTLNFVKPSTTEVGAYTGRFGGLSSMLFPDAATLNSRLGQLSGQSTIEYLSEIKSRSEGNPLAGNISDRDTRLAQQAAANLNQTDKTDELRRNLLRYDQSLENIQLKLKKEDTRTFEQYLKETAQRETTAPQVGEVSTQAGEIATRKDPALAGTNAKVRAMLKAGVPQNVIVDYLNSVRPGLGDGAIPSLNAVERWKAANPDYRGGYKVDLEKEYYRTTPTQSIIGRAATSAPGAYAIQAANTLALGGLPQLTARPEETEAVIRGLSETKPISSALGQVSGSLIGVAGPAAALRAVGAAPSIAALASEAAFGAGTGAVTAGEGERLRGAAAGAGLSLLGSAIGSGVTKLAANVVAPAISKEVRMAAQADVPMSLGTMLGGGYKSFEERLANVIPFFDTQLQKVSDEAAEKAQVRVFDEVLAPLGAKYPKDAGIGEDAFKYFEGTDQSKGFFEKKYDDLYAQMRFSRTPDVDQKISDLVNEVSSRPGLTQDEVSQFSRDLANTVIGPITRRKGYLTGEEFGKVMSNLKTAKRAAYKKSDELGAAFNDLQGILEEGAIAATKSKNVGETYRNLSDAYRKYLIVKTAAARPGGGVGELTGTSLKNVAAAAEGPTATVTGEGPLTSLGRMMQMVTPAGASGSPTMRNASIAGALGLGALNYQFPEEASPLTAAVGTAALPFIAGSSRRLNPAMRALVTGQRPQPVQALADFTRRAVAPAAAAATRQTLLQQYAQSQEEERLRRMAEGR